VLLARGTVAGGSQEPAQGSHEDVRPISFKLNILKQNIKKMANHKSSLKRIRQDKKKALHNHYYAKTMRNAVRKLRAMTNKDEATALYPKVQKMLDKLAKTNIIHKNKAANLKSSLSQHINKLG
jgi:small subunit ribosomal protein S20